MAEFFAMGGYAEFVWGSFGLTALIMIFNVVSARRRLRVTLERVTLRAVHQNRTAASKQSKAEEGTEL